MELNIRLDYRCINLLLSKYGGIHMDIKQLMFQDLMEDIIQADYCLSIWVVNL